MSVVNAIKVPFRAGQSWKFSDSVKKREGGRLVAFPGTGYEIRLAIRAAYGDATDIATIAGTIDADGAIEFEILPEHSALMVGSRTFIGVLDAVSGESFYHPLAIFLFEMMT